MMPQTKYIFLSKKNSKIAFVLYGLILIANIALPILSITSQSLVLIFQITSLVALVLYLVYLLRSFLNQSNFFKKIGKNYGVEGALVYFFLGMPFYIFTYFYFRNQMNTEMKTIK